MLLCDEDIKFTTYVVGVNFLHGMQFINEREQTIPYEITYPHFVVIALTVIRHATQ